MYVIIIIIIIIIIIYLFIYLFIYFNFILFIITFFCGRSDAVGILIDSDWDVSQKFDGRF